MTVENTGHRSIIKRLKSTMMAVALFFIFSAIALYVASLGFFSSVQEMNSANVILTFTNQSIVALETSSEALERLRKKENQSNIKFAFHENQKFLNKSVAEAVKSAKVYPEVMKILIAAQDTLKLHQEEVDRLLFEIENKKISPRDISEELLSISQYSIEALENLRKAQIVLRKNSDETFKSIYENRFLPLYVAIGLSGTFFLFVVFFGFSVANDIGLAVKNLSQATFKVREGELNYKAPVLQNDEFGYLTEEFNKMVSSLKSGRITLDLAIEKLQNLQKITASFSEALTADEVMDVTFNETYAATNSTLGMIALANDKNDLSVKRFKGFGKDIRQKWTEIPLSVSTPLVDAYKRNQPLFLNREELDHLYPNHSIVKDYDIKVLVAIPLSVGGRVLGVLSFDFTQDKILRDEDKDFMLAIARQCAQALLRAQFYDESKKAIMVRDEFLSIASHELKTPLTPLKLQLQLLSRQIKGGVELNTDKLTRTMENSDRQLNRLSKLIEDLLDVTRITSGKFNLHMEKVSLKGLIKDVLDQYGHQLKDVLKYIQVDAQEDIEVYCDPLRIEQVLINLLTNAAKYAPGKPIKIKLQKEAGSARISVKDQGPGIDKDHQMRIFKRFERVEDSENIGGLGLGLYISHQIVEAHRGKIFVISHPGDGSEFIFDLPV